MNQLSKEHYLDYSINDPEISDKLQLLLDFDRDGVGRSVYNASLGRDFILDRVSESALLSLGVLDRAIATKDSNFFSLNNVDASGLLDPLVKEFEFLSPLKIICSGRFWYPVNGYMGWHTNSNNYGYRFYCTYVPEGGKSFFRYRDPLSGQIITSWDRVGWSFRLFRISSESLWHCVYSETDRISIGYTIFVS